MLSFLRTIMLSLVGVLIYIPTNSAGGLPSLHSLCRIYCCRIFDKAILINVRWYLIVHLICFSLRTREAEHLFMCFIAISTPSLEKCAFGPLVDCFNWIVWVLILHCTCCLYVLDINSLWVSLFARIFFHSEGWLFSFTCDFLCNFSHLLGPICLLLFYFSWFWEMDHKCCILRQSVFWFCL